MTSPRPDPPTQSDVEDYFTTLSNWGRWGDDDRLGTLNLITDAKRVEAAGLIDSGRTISLSRDIDPRDPDPLGTGLSRVERFMQLDWAGHMFDQPLRYNGATETVVIFAHGSPTHVDGLGHYSWDGFNYNGFAAKDTTSLGGAQQLSVHHAAHGAVTRGVLLDIPRLHGLEWLPPEYQIHPDELEAAEREQGVRVGSGDALIVHTGNVRAVLADDAQKSDRAGRQPGLHASCLPYLRERDVAVLGSDAIQDVQPSGYSLDLRRPIHTVGLVAMGLWLIDNMEVTELAEACAAGRRWEFFFAALPWRMVGVTSSATNPVAIL